MDGIWRTFCIPVLIIVPSVLLYFALIHFLTPNNKYEQTVAAAWLLLISALAIGLLKRLAPWLFSVEEGGEEQNILAGQADRNYNTFKTVERNIEYSSPAMAERCTICLVDFENGERVLFLLPCLHYFHTHCIGPWIQYHCMCPICRRPIHRASKATSGATEISVTIVQDPAIAIGSTGNSPRNVNAQSRYIPNDVTELH